MTTINKKDKNIICRCEEVTEEEVIEAIKAGARTVDDIKRATRAGMGLCQSKTCFINVARILSKELKIPIENFKPIKIRIPVRPISVNILADDDEL
jgi:NAD(P)H-nitrite reductase large subunit